MPDPKSYAGYVDAAYLARWRLSMRGKMSGRARSSPA
jgi:hypothetical protein